MLHMYPGLASWAKFSRPFGTKTCCCSHTFFFAIDLKSNPDTKHAERSKEILPPRVHGDEAQLASSPAIQQQTDSSHRDRPIRSQLPVAAVVQQDVAAAVALLVVPKAASYSRCQFLGIRGFPIVGGHVPHHLRH